MYRVAIAAGLLLLTSVPATADVPASTVSAAESKPPSPDDRPHALYLDLFGKGGAWGAGYDYRWRRFAIGAVASYYSYDGDHITTFAPYLAYYPIVRHHNALFLQAGPDIVRRTTPSPVPEWMGFSTTKVGTEASLGYEWRSTMVFRVYGMISANDHIVPWVGGSIGWTL